MKSLEQYIQHIKTNSIATQWTIHIYTYHLNTKLFSHVKGLWYTCIVNTYSCNMRYILLSHASVIWSNSYPGLHVQRYAPGVLRQSPRSHSSGFSAHSLISVKWWNLRYYMYFQHADILILELSWSFTDQWLSVILQVKLLTWS